MRDRIFISNGKTIEIKFKSNSQAKKKDSELRKMKKLIDKLYRGKLNLD